MRVRFDDPADSPRGGQTQRLSIVSAGNFHKGVYLNPLGKRFQSGGQCREAGQVGGGQNPFRAGGDELGLAAAGDDDEVFGPGPPRPWSDPAEIAMGDHIDVDFAALRARMADRVGAHLRFEVTPGDKRPILLRGLIAGRHNQFAMAAGALAREIFDQFALQRYTDHVRGKVLHSGDLSGAETAPRQG